MDISLLLKQLIIFVFVIKLYVKGENTQSVEYEAYPKSKISSIINGKGPMQIVQRIFSKLKNPDYYFKKQFSNTDGIGKFLDTKRAVFEPDPNLPKELNDFLLEVQNHKNDFRCIRQIARSVLKNKKNMQNYREFANELSKYVNDRPTNDLYPYMYRKSFDGYVKDRFNSRILPKELFQDNDYSMSRYRRHLFDDLPQIIIQPKSSNGELNVNGEKYPGRQKNPIQGNQVDAALVNMANQIKEQERQRMIAQQRNTVDPIKEIHNILRDNKYRKRELEIQVKNNGKLIKEFHENPKEPKTIVFNINPSNTDDSFELSKHMQLMDNKAPYAQGHESSVNPHFEAGHYVPSKSETRQKFIVGPYYEQDNNDSPNPFTFLKKFTIIHDDDNNNNNKENPATSQEQPTKHITANDKNLNNHLNSANSRDKEVKLIIQKGNEDRMIKNNDARNKENYFSNSNTRNNIDNNNNNEFINNKNNMINLNNELTPQKDDWVKQNVHFGETYKMKIPDDNKGFERIKSLTLDNKYLIEEPSAKKHPVNIIARRTASEDEDNTREANELERDEEHFNELSNTIHNLNKKAKSANSKLFSHDKNDNKFAHRVRQYSKILGNRESHFQRKIRREGTDMPQDLEISFNEDLYAPASFKSRNLKELSKTFDSDSYYDYGDLNEKTNKHVRKATTVRVKTQAAEGDYNDEEDSYTSKEHIKKYDKIKNTNNIFAHPQSTTADSDYYDDDDEKSQLADKEKADIKRNEINSNIPEELNNLVPFVHHKPQKHSKQRSSKVPKIEIKSNPEIRPEIHRDNTDLSAKIGIIRNDNTVNQEQLVGVEKKRSFDDFKKFLYPIFKSSSTNTENYLTTSNTNVNKNKRDASCTTQCPPFSIPCITTCQPRKCTTGANKANTCPSQKNTKCKITSLVSGQIPMKIVNSIFRKFNSIDCNSKKFPNGGLAKFRNYKDQSNFDLSDNNDSPEIRDFFETLNNLLHDYFEETSTCMQLTSTLKNYLRKIVNARVKEFAEPCEDNENAEYDNHQNDMLFRKNVLGGNNLNQIKPCDYAAIREKIKSLNNLLEKYNALSDKCQGQARQVKEYIVNHLRVLTSTLKGIAQLPECEPTPPDDPCPHKPSCPAAGSCRNLVQKQLESVGLGSKDRFQPNFDLDQMVEKEIKNTASGCAAVAPESNMGEENIKKRTIENPNKKQSQEYKKLVDAVNDVRRRRISEDRIGELFGQRKSQQDDLNQNDGPEIAKIQFESPVVYSL